MATLGLNISAFTQGLNEAKKEAGSKGKEVAGALGEELQNKLASLVSVVAVEEGIRRIVEYGSSIHDLALRLGISTDAVQQWDFALKQNGSSIEAATKFFEKLAISRDKALGGGEGAAAKIEDFRKLGISLEQLKTSRVEDVAAVIAKGFEAGDPQALIAPLREIGGKSAGELVTAFREGLGEALGEAPLISPDDINSLNDAAVAMKAFKAETTSMFAPLVAGLAEGAMGMIDFARERLAVVVGMLLGTVEELRKVHTFGDMMHFIGGGLKKAAIEGGDEALQAVYAQEAQRDLFWEKKNARKPFVTDMEEGDGSKKHKEAEKDFDRIEKQIDAEQRKAYMEGHTHEERLAYIHAEIAALADKEQTETDALKRKELQLELAKKAVDLVHEEKETDKEWDKKNTEKTKEAFDGKRYMYETNALQKTGGIVGTFSSSNEIAMTDYLKDSTNHLSEIRKDIRTLVFRQGETIPDDVTF